MPVLKQGSKGPEVTALQIQLKTLGFDPNLSAGFIFVFFSSNNIRPICDKGANDATVTAVSTRVNGQNPHVVPERIQFFKEYFRALTLT